MPTPTGTHHYDALLGIRASVEPLDLPGIDPDRIYVQELLTYREGLIALPAVVISKAPMPESHEIFDDTYERVGYPCLLTLLAAADQDPTLTEAPARRRQLVEECFDHEANHELEDSLSVELDETTWQPLDCVDLERFHVDGLVVSAGIIMVYVFKSR